MPSVVMVKSYFKLIRLISFVLMVGPAVCSAQSGLCGAAAPMLKEVSAIRGLSVKRSVLCVVSSRETIQKFLDKTMETKLPAEKVQHEELVYRALGVIPESYDYEKGLLALYSSHIGGYYDPEEKHFVMADWIPVSLQEGVAAHELTHALQDQHYNLEQLLDPRQENGDKLLAYSAFIEGDAVLVMADYMRALRGERAVVKEQVVESFFTNAAEPTPTSVISEETKQIPPALREIVMFPYEAGVAFAHSILRSVGSYRGIDDVFKNPPTSSREILHPEEYLSRARSQKKVRVPEVSEVEVFVQDEQPVYSDTLGELGIRAILCQGHNDRAACVKAAEGWLGDRVVIFRGKRTGKMQKILWLTRWETSADAAEFSKAYHHFFEQQQQLAVSTVREDPQVMMDNMPKIQQKESAVVVSFLLSNR